MSEWRHHRRHYCSAHAAVDASYRPEWLALAEHPVVKAALLQIEMAEAAILVAADEMYEEYTE